MLFRSGVSSGSGTTTSIAAWFKEFGDPRILSRRTGNYYPSIEAMRVEEGPHSAPATEIMHFSVFSPHSSYGIPRWIGNLPGVLGSRELDQVNEQYFDNKAVPPLALLVNGGRLGRDAVTRIEEFFATQTKGVRNFHKILVLEAERAESSTGPTAPSMNPKVEFVPLREAQQSDALFQNYDIRNLEKLATSFRVPSVLRGETSRLPAVSLLTAMRQAEEQVFGPERDEFDDILNRRILPELGIRFWTFKSNAPAMRNPEALATVIAELTVAGVLTPAEGRELASGVFNKELPPIAESWTSRPLVITLATLKAVSGPAEAARVSETGEGSRPEELLDSVSLAPEDAVLDPPKPRKSRGLPSTKPMRPLRPAGRRRPEIDEDEDGETE